MISTRTSGPTDILYQWTKTGLHDNATGQGIGEGMYGVKLKSHIAATLRSTSTVVPTKLYAIKLYVKGIIDRDRDKSYQTEDKPDGLQVILV